MSNFIYNSIFTNYALNRISKNLAELGMDVSTFYYKLGSNVTINKFDPSNSDFSGLNISSITPIYNIEDKDKNNYNIILSIDPNEANSTFSQVGIFDEQGFVLGLVTLTNPVLVRDLQETITRATVEYRLYISINAKTGNIIVKDKDNKILGNGNTLYGFVSVKLGQGSNDLDTTKTDVSMEMYPLDIYSIEVDENAVTIKAYIPEELKGISITEIGLFENFYPDDKWIERNEHFITRPKTKSHMFFYSKVDVFKPEDLGYFLKIQLNLKLNIVRFEGLPDIKMNKYEYAVKSDLDELNRAFLYMEANLERIISNNGQEIGYNLPEVYYADMIQLRDQLNSINYANRCNQIIESIDEHVKDIFFMDDQNYIEYKILNLVKNNSYLKMNTLQGNKFISTNDSVTFNDGALSIALTGKIKSTFNNGVILTKDDGNGGIYFNFNLDSNGDDRQLKFVIMSSPNAIGFTYDLDESDYRSFMESNYLNYVITFNGSIVNPEFNFYIDGNLQEIELLEGESTTLNDLSAFSLTNYRKDVVNEIASRYLGEWNCATGLAVYSTVDLPYFNYTTGDFYVVHEVSETSNANYRPPEGIGPDQRRQASTTGETLRVTVGDLYVFNGTTWDLVKISPMHMTRLAVFDKVLTNDEVYKLNINLSAT